MNLQIRHLTRRDTAMIGGWQYDPPYDTYNVPPEAADLMTDPAQRFSAVCDGDDLIAYVCLGREARVNGLHAEANTEDLGFGLRPDLMGCGLSREILPWLLSVLEDRIRVDRLRVVILDWNARSLAAYRRAGFSDVSRHTNDNGTFLLLIRARSSPRETP